MIIPKSRRTYDPEYKKAKDLLKSYSFDSKKLISSIRQLGDRAQEISKFYLKFSFTVKGWYPDSTPAIRQSLESINNSAISLDKITTDSFTNSVVPTFVQTFKEYKKQMKELHKLQQNRKKAVNSLDQNKEKLRRAQCAKEPNEAKIDQLQRKVDACENTYNTQNDQFISAVYDFADTRKDKLLRSFKKCISGLTQYINLVAQIQFIRFPDDPDSPLIVDPKSVYNSYDLAQHINVSQTILPPSASNNNGQQLPTYFHNDYNQGLANSQSTPSNMTNVNSPQQTQSSDQGFALLPPSAGYVYDPSSQQNQGSNNY